MAIVSSNNNWVCFSCKYHKREPKIRKSTPHCIYCKRELYCLGYKIPVPKKHKVKEWEELECCMYWRDIENLEEKQKSRVESKHRIEREIKELIYEIKELIYEIKELIYEKKDTKENRKRLKKLKGELENCV